MHYTKCKSLEVLCNVQAAEELEAAQLFTTVHIRHLICFWPRMLVWSFLQSFLTQVKSSENQYRCENTEKMLPLSYCTENDVYGVRHLDQLFC